MRNIISFVCAFVLLLSMLCVGGISFASAEILQEGDYEYEIINECEAKITGYTGGKDVEIPSTLGGYTVTTIGSDAFAEMDIDTLMLPRGLMCIEDRAFDCYVNLALFNGSYDEWNALRDNIGWYNNLEVYLYHQESGIYYEKDRGNPDYDSICVLGYIGTDSEFTIPREIDRHCVTAVACCFNYDYYDVRHVYFEGTPEEWLEIRVEGGNEELEHDLAWCDEGYGLLYSFNGYSITIKGAWRELGYLEIPPEIRDYPVTKIEREAFVGQSFDVVTLPVSITSIGEDAFDCAINYAFFYDGDIYDGHLSLPSDYLYWTEMVEEGNRSLEQALVIPYGDFAIKLSAPNDYHGATIVSYIGSNPDFIEIPSECHFARNVYSVTAIGTKAFSHVWNIGTIILPDTITYIEKDAFMYTSIQRAYLYNADTHRWSNDWGRIDIGGDYWQHYNGSLVNAMVYCSDQYTYQSNGYDATILTVPYALDIEIPEYVDGYLVRAIASHALNGYDINSITLPSSIGYIQSDAFANCSLRYVYYAGSPEDWEGVAVESGNYVLQSAISFKEGPFWYHINANNTVSIRRYDGEINGTHLTIPSEIGGYPVSSIEYQALYTCSNVKTLYLPKSVTSIEEDSLPSSLRTIYYSGIESDREQMDIDDDHADDYDCTWYYNVKSYGKDDQFSYYIKNDNTVTIQQYVGNEAKVTIPSTIEGYPVTAIEESAFKSCSSMTSIAIPEGVKTIGSYAFRNCNNLRDVQLPKNLQVIGDYAFDGCSSLTFIAIPEGAETIGSYAFSECYNLRYIQLPKSLRTIGDCAFYYNQLHCTYYAGSPDDRAYMTIGDNNSFNFWYYGVAQIGQTHDDALENDNVYAYYITHDGTATITECLTDDTHVVIPSTFDGYTIAAIGENTFASNTNIREIVISNGITTIGNSAFSGCTALENIVFSDSITTIGFKAFSGCSSLKNIVIPDSVTSIASRAFENTAYYNDSANWDNYGLYIGNCLIVAKDVKADRFTVREGTRMIADNAFGDGLMTIAIPKSVTVIGDNAFYVSYGSALCGIYYGGTQANWRAITFGENADVSNRVMIHYTEAPEPTRGDLNGDDTIDMRDAFALYIAASGGSELTGEQEAAADMNGDGDIDMRDAFALYIIASGG